MSDEKKEPLMQVGHAWVEINDLHDNVQLRNITPAEILVVRKQFGIKVPGQAKPTSPVTHLDIAVTSIARSKDDEFTRLVKKYGDKLISTVFPGENPNIPLTFKEAGVEATEESAPKAGKPTEVIELAKLDKKETTDEESANEVAERLKAASAMAAKDEQINKLMALVEKLTAQPAAKPVEDTAPKTQAK